MCTKTPSPQAAPGFHTKAAAPPPAAPNIGRGGAVRDVEERALQEKRKFVNINKKEEISLFRHERKKLSKKRSKKRGKK